MCLKVSFENFIPEGSSKSFSLFSALIQETTSQKRLSFSDMSSFEKKKELLPVEGFFHLEYLSSEDG